MKWVIFELDKGLGEHFFSIMLVQKDRVKHRLIFSVRALRSDILLSLKKFGNKIIKNSTKM